MRVGALLAVVLAAFLITWPAGVRGQTPSSKLATVLADLAAAVRQTPGGSVATPAELSPPAFASLPRSLQDAVRSRRLRLNARNEVQVYVLVTGVSDAVRQQLAAAGATIEIADDAHARLQARVPASRLQAIAALPFVTFIRPPTYARRHAGAATTEGDAILGADLVRQQFSLDGTGIKVGVISDGLKGVFATGCTVCGGVAGGPIASGDLPSATGTRSVSGVLSTSSGGILGQSFTSNHDLEGLPPASPPCAFAGAGAEGTALLEIVHDLAPGAQLSFANADTDLAFEQAVNALAAGNDVVVDDLGFYGEPYDGTSGVSSNTATALNNPANRIRTYITSAGNGADEHYLGTYVDSGIDGTTISGVPSAGHLHLFQRTATTTDVLGLGDQPYNLIALPTSGEVAIYLTWDEPFGRASNNYDLYLVRQSTNTVVARSVDRQAGGQDPMEAIDFTNTGATDFFRIVVQNVNNQASARRLNLFSFQPECAPDGPRLLAAGHHERHNFNTASQSVAAQSDAGGSPVSVISAGAICSGSAAAAGQFTTATPDESCNDRRHTTVEFFSSQGPTIDGRPKPDIAAIDGVSVTGAGGFANPFFGTSAAAPHVAGEAALVLQAAPCLMNGAAGALAATAARASLRTLILRGAQPLSDAAPADPLAGAGLANALASVQKALPVFNGPPTLVVPGNSAAGVVLGPAALGFTDPDQCPLTRLAWTGGCGVSPGAALACPFGTTTVSVAATNGVAFSPPAGVRITVSDFALAPGASAVTVTAGQTATFHLSVSAQGGAFQNPVALSCSNAPPGATCSFSTPAVIPGSTASDVTVTIATSARAAVFPTFVRGLPAVMTVAALVAVFARRRRLRLAAAVTLVGLAVACGSKSSSNNSSNTGVTSVTLLPGSLRFPSQTVGSTSAPQVVTLTNAGTADAAVSSVSASGDFAASSACGPTLASAENCTIVVTFTPAAAGPRTGALSVVDNATGSPQRVTLSGAGVSASGGTPAGTYQLTLSGASGALVHATPVTLVVN